MSKIEKEFDNDNNKFWFYRKNQKNLHNIDNFYYDVFFENDFTDVSDQYIHQLKLSLNAFKTRLVEATTSFGEIFTPFDLFGFNTGLNLTLIYTYPPAPYAHIYSHCIKCPDFFDILIAEKVPNEFTPPIIVQIRSKEIWISGIYNTFDISFSVVKSLSEYFNLNIVNVKENRCDYAFHTNYLQAPEKYLHIDNFSKMQVSHFKRATYQYQFKSNDEYENDYICLGKKGDKVFVRMYLKTKEVVEMGYKSYFINLWFYNELISRYDKYVLENCYDLKNWKVLDIIRLQFYYDYGSNEQLRNECYAAMESYFKTSTPNWDYIGKLADKLTPRVTKILNVEFQVMRKFSKSFENTLPDLHPGNEVEHHIYKYLDNHALITDYLTHSVLRLVDRNTALKKSQCDYTAFWQSIRRTKMIEFKNNRHISKLTREYSNNHDSEIVKNQFIHKAVTLGIYSNGLDYNADIHQNIADLICLINDNDVINAQRYLSKIKYRLSSTLSHKE